MESFSIYILKSAGLLSLFYLVYLFLLTNDTGFELTRKFLILGIIAAALLPAAVFTKTILVEPQEATIEPFMIPEGLTDDPMAAEQEFLNGWQIAGGIYLLGMTFFLIRFGFQLRSLIRIIRSQPRHKEPGITILYTQEAIPPFSFFKYIILNPKLHPPAELEIILAHEKIHASQNHSLDVLMANLTTAILWFNPLAWFYKKSILQNLEFIADKETVARNISRKDYQQTLLKVCLANSQPALTNSFYQSFIKKRILMLHKKSTSNNLWKMATAIPLVVAFMLVFNVKTLAQVKPSEDKTTIVHAEKHAVSISKDSSPEDLERVKKFMLEQNLVLEFKDIDRSPEGILRSITIEYRNKNTNTSGNLTKNDPNGIDAFEIFVNSRGETGVADIPEYLDAATNARQGILTDIGLNPLYIINNQEYPSDQLYGKSILLKSGYVFLSPKEALETYGDKAKDGVILVSEGEIIDELKEEMKKTDFENIHTTSRYIQIEEGEKPVIIKVNTSGKKSQKSSTGTSKSTKIKIKKTSQSSQAGDGTEISELEGAMVYVLNGKIIEKSEIEFLDTSTIKGVNVIKGAAATSEYGNAAQDGAVLITTKKISNKIKTPKTAKNKKVVVIASGSNEEGSGAASILTVDNQRVYVHPQGSKTSTMAAGNPRKENILYVIDDREVAKDFEISTINPEEIASINVLKGDTAVKKYGKKAKNGVVEIRTKKTSHEQNSKIFVIKSSFSDAQLETLRATAKQQGDFKLSFKNIKRNSLGLIKSIDVSLSGEGQKASASYDVKDGIPDIHVGQKSDGGFIVSSNPAK